MESPPHTVLMNRTLDTFGERNNSLLKSIRNKSKDTPQVDGEDEEEGEGSTDKHIKQKPLDISKAS